MEVKIISDELIKPSLPTPPHLTTFKLCLLDQLIPAPYAPIVLYYPNLDPSYAHHRVLERLLLLKRSLAETLTRFYPLAGVIKDDDELSVHCNDHGAFCVTAKVNRRLGEFLGRPELEFISEFLPCRPCFSGSLAGTTTRPVTSVQINVFVCGGVAIGLCVSHKIVDGFGLSSFLRSWAGTACAAKEIVFPSFVGSSLFPAEDLWLRDASMAMWGSLFKTGKCVTKRFLFDSSAITRLKTMAAATVRRPTQVEVVSACIWKSAMQAAASDQDSGRRSSLLTHLVNLRKRAAPPFSEHAMGNLIWVAAAQTATRTGGGDLPGLVNQIRNSISKIDGDYVKSMRSGEQGRNLMRKTMKDIEDFAGGYLGFTSWCKIGFYEVDFGFGKPVWVSPTSSTGSAVFMNLVVLMETKNGDGIEAWITLDEEEMQRFEESQDLLGFNCCPKL
ncbi:PREDICTED: vinorine synthase-like [Ipomoea nil]|uniref:vinorine synthase-like n=1 Tax=Ipomoea nil TaxID=35883 RepID=UPI000900D345|nr:PREDICTED: vinorine synthase-like [Ipomoea nil]